MASYALDPLVVKLSKSGAEGIPVFCVVLIGTPQCLLALLVLLALRFLGSGLADCCCLDVLRRRRLAHLLPFCVSHHVEAWKLRLENRSARLWVAVVNRKISLKN